MMMQKRLNKKIANYVNPAMRGNLLLLPESMLMANEGMLSAWIWQFQPPQCAHFGGSPYPSAKDRAHQMVSQFGA
jgi:hypothetical protein